MEHVAIEPRDHLQSRFHAAVAASVAGGGATVGVDGLGAADRAAYLAARRRRCQGFPWQEVHPSWLASCLPTDALTRLWALDVLPRPTRAQVLEYTEREPTLRTTAHGAPEWFADWWQHRVRNELRFHDAHGGGADATVLFDRLVRSTPDDVVRLLRRFGLRAVAAGLRGHTKEQIVGLVVGLPAVARTRLSELMCGGEVARGGLDDGVAWQEQLTHALDEAEEPEDLPVRLALEDLGTQAPALEHTAGAHRLALRLPRAIGRHLKRRLADGPGELAATDLAQWRAGLLEDLDYLVGVGAIRMPEIETEAR